MRDLTSKYINRYDGKINPNLDFLINEYLKFKILVLQGGTRSGKTYAVVDFLIWIIENYTGLTISVVRETLPALKATILRDFKDEALKFGIWSDYKFNKTELEFRHKGNLIEFFSVDNEQKVRGRKRDILIANEANEITAEKMQQLLLRLEGFAIIDYNPSMVTSYIYDDILTREDCALLVTNYTHNPHLSKNIIAEIELLKTTDPEAWAVYGEGKRGSNRAGLIYPDWKKVKEFPAHLHWWYGIDFGFTNDPTAAVRQCFDRNRQILYHEEVIYQKGLYANDIAALIKEDIRNKRTEINETTFIQNGIIVIGTEQIDLNEWSKNKSILQYNEDEIKIIERVASGKYTAYCDAAEPRTIGELNRCGLTAAKCLGKNDIAERVTFLYQFENLYIGKNIEDELSKYKWVQRKDNEKEFKNKPIDAFNHLMDACGYGAYTHLKINGYK